MLVPGAFTTQPPRFAEELDASTHRKLKKLYEYLERNLNRGPKVGCNVFRILSCLNTIGWQCIIAPSRMQAKNRIDFLLSHHGRGFDLIMNFSRKRSSWTRKELLADNTLPGFQRSHLI